MCFFETANLKLIKIFKDIHKNPILDICIYFEHEKSISFCKLLSTDNVGNVFSVTLDKGIFTYDVIKKQILSNLENPVLQIETFQTFEENSFNKYKIMGLVSMVNVYLISLEPRIYTISQINKPKNAKGDNHPTISFDLYNKKNCPLIAIGWDKEIFLYTIEVQIEDDEIRFIKNLIGFSFFF